MTTYPQPVRLTWAGLSTGSKNVAHLRACTDNCRHEGKFRTGAA
ncbi:hypothetical protein HMPREF9599_01694 [Cutibacterium acnes HL050PA2]|nr:hypothetical protein HMPREF9567_00533 [Cutibacterium acnes HL013PA1]EFT76968.1 hypothetical protein HMPREF9599_01694 [Cutibacterium acnes HL050PA2]